VSLLEAVAVLAAGLFAGTINTVVGSGSLVTFPVLLGLGYSPLVANVTNTVGLVPGSLSGALGYRQELVGQRARLLRLGSASLLGGITGGLLLLARPDAFQAVVPWLVIGASLLMAAQPSVSGWLRRRQGAAPPRPSRVLLPALIFLSGIYGGYFGAAQGIILLAVLGTLEQDRLQRLNATKNVLALLVNGVAAVLFVVVSPVAWSAAALLAVGAVVGGQLGARVGRRIPDGLLRVVVVVFGLAVGVLLLVA
jgi:uncharacterized membrane protein YfcA